MAMVKLKDWHPSHKPMGTAADADNPRICPYCLVTFGVEGKHELPCAGTYGGKSATRATVQLGAGVYLGPVVPAFEKYDDVLRQRYLLHNTVQKLNIDAIVHTATGGGYVFGPFPMPVLVKGIGIFVQGSTGPAHIKARVVVQPAPVDLAAGTVLGVKVAGGTPMEAFKRAVIECCNAFDGVMTPRYFGP